MLKAKLLIALALLCATGAMSATAAQATEGPFWKVEGKRLLAGEKHNITGNQVGAATLTNTASGIVITCQKATVTGVLIGSTGANAGRDEETITLTECTVSGNDPNCTVSSPGQPAGTIVVTLASALDYEGQRTGRILHLFAPKEGTTFVTLELKGECKFPSTTVSGTLDCEAWVPKAKPVEVGVNEVEGTTGEINCSGTPPKEDFFEKEGGLTKLKSGLTVFGTAGKFKALFEIKLEGSKKWGIFTK